ncbi:MAG TPA: hypothetical protein VK014_06635 [Cyclobacteriaceae bacterium]|nr:hypothetical protein [Cyclobacteriaceae bacterium]
MRVIKELSLHAIKVSVFSWNNKYLIKFEQGMIEQTYKVSEMDLADEEELEVFWSEAFMSEVQKRFDEMHQSLRNQLENI